MTYPTPYDVLMESVKDLVDRTMEITAVASTGNSHVLTVCDVKYAEAGQGFTVDINSVNYTITDVDDEALTITVQGLPAPPVTSFDLYEIHFFVGTPLETAEDLNKIQDAKDKIPMVWLLDNYTVRTVGDVLQQIERRIPDSRLFFLTRADQELDQETEIRSLRVRAMERLMYLWKQAMKDSGFFSMDQYDHDDKPHVRFGVYVGGRGKEKSVFADRLSGIEHISAPDIYRGVRCEPC